VTRLVRAIPPLKKLGRLVRYGFGSDPS